ncbi:MAG: glycosyltransferase family 39 protein [Myxococcota bacterium]
MYAPGSPSDAPIWPIVGITAATSFVSSLPTLLFPLGRDQGNYATAGWVWSEGGVLYRDALTFKPPATAWLHGMSQLLFGTNPVACRIWDSLWTTATIALLTWLAWRLFRRRDVALVAGTVYALLYWRIGYWHITQADGWLNLPAIAAIGLILAAGDAWAEGRRGPAMLGYVAAGAASAFTVLFKYTAGLIALPMLVAFALSAATHGVGVWWGLVGVVGGGLGTLGLTLFSLVAQGAGEIFRRTHTELLSTYINDAQEGLSSRFNGIGRSLRRDHRNAWSMIVSGFIGIGPALLAFIRLTPRHWIAGALVVTWWAMGLVGVMMQGRFFAYHYHPTLPPAALLVGLGSTWLLDLGPRLGLDRLWHHRGLPFVAAVVSLLLCYANQPQRYRSLFRVAGGYETLNEHYALPRYKVPTWPIPDQGKVAAYLRAETSPDDPVLAWAFDPAIHVLAQRRPASTLIYNFPLALRTTDHEFWLDVLMTDLERTKPPIIVVGTDDGIPYMTGFDGDSSDLLESHEPLYLWVTQHYQKVDPIGVYEIWKRRER